METLVPFFYYKTCFPKASITPILLAMHNTPSCSDLPVIESRSTLEQNKSLLKTVLSLWRCTIKSPQSLLGIYFMVDSHPQTPSEKQVEADIFGDCHCYPSIIQTLSSTTSPSRKRLYVEEPQETRKAPKAWQPQETRKAQKAWQPQETRKPFKRLIPLRRLWVWSLWRRAIWKLWGRVRIWTLWRRVWGGISHSIQTMQWETRRFSFKLVYWTLTLQHGTCGSTYRRPPFFSF